MRDRKAELPPEGCVSLTDGRAQPRAAAPIGEPEVTRRGRGAQQAPNLQTSLTLALAGRSWSFSMGSWTADT